MMDAAIVALWVVAGLLGSVGMLYALVWTTIGQITRGDIMFGIFMGVTFGPVSLLMGAVAAPLVWIGQKAGGSRVVFRREPPHASSNQAMR